MSKQKLELEARLLNSSYGYVTKYMYTIEKELRQINNLASEYDYFTQKFNQLKKDLKQNLASRKSNTDTENKSEQNKFELLSEKFKTPLVKKTISIFSTQTKPAEDDVTPTNENSSNSSRKRSAKLTEDQEEIEIDQEEVEVEEAKKTKSTKVKTSKKKKKVKSKKENEENPCKKAKLLAEDQEIEAEPKK